MEEATLQAPERIMPICSSLNTEARKGPFGCSSKIKNFLILELQPKRVPFPCQQTLGPEDPPPERSSRRFREPSLFHPLIMEEATLQAPERIMPICSSLNTEAKGRTLRLQFQN